MDHPKTLAPTYMQEFKCIGAACEDTCCAGWYIAVDEATYKKYKKVKEPVMKKRLDKELVVKRSALGEDHVAKIKLKNNRCAFLSKEGWCDIYSTLGEAYLSKTCTLYPRTINKVNETLEYSLALSCPEAARQVLLNKEPMTFEPLIHLGSVRTISGEIRVNNKKPQKWQDYFEGLRDFIITLLQDRKRTLDQRFQLLENFMYALEKSSKGKVVHKIPLIIKEYQGKYKTLPEVKGQGAHTPPSMSLVLHLKSLREEKKWPSVRYEECYEEMLQGIGLEAGNDLKMAIKQYETGYKLYYQPFIEKKGHLLENYFVNYVFERGMPLDGETPLESFKKMKLYAQLIKVHLVGMANIRKGLDEEVAIKLIQSFTKTFDHNELYLNKLMKLTTE